MPALKIGLFLAIFLILLFGGYYYFQMQKTNEIPKAVLTITPTIMPIPSEGQYVPGEFVVEFSEDVSPANATPQLQSQLDSLAKKYQVKEVRPIGQTGPLQFFYKVTILENAQLQQAMEDYGKLPGVKSVSPNQIQTTNK